MEQLSEMFIIVFLLYFYQQYSLSILDETVQKLAKMIA